MVTNLFSKIAVSKKLIQFLPKKGVIGLGSGSTCEVALQEIAKHADLVQNLKFLPTSKAIEKVSLKLGLQIIYEAKNLDFTFDGADWIDNKLNLLKGYGGALWKEKILARDSQKYFILADDSKLCESFVGKKITVEISVFQAKNTLAVLESFGLQAVLRSQKNQSGQEKPIITDGGNLLVDCIFEKIPDLKKVSLLLKDIVGVVEVGIFLLKPDAILIGQENGAVKIL